MQTGGLGRCHSGRRTREGIAPPRLGRTRRRFGPVRERVALAEPAHLPELFSGPAPPSFLGHPSPPHPGRALSPCPLCPHFPRPLQTSPQLPAGRSGSSGCSALHVGPPSLCLRGGGATGELLMRRCPLWRPRAETGVARAPEKGQTGQFGSPGGVQMAGQGERLWQAFASLPHLGLGRAGAGVSGGPQTDGARSWQACV